MKKGANKGGDELAKVGNTNGVHEKKKSKFKEVKPSCTPKQIYDKFLEIRELVARGLGKQVTAASVQDTFDALELDFLSTSRKKLGQYELKIQTVMEELRYRVERLSTEYRIEQPERIVSGKSTRATGDDTHEADLAAAHALETDVKIWDTGWRNR